MKIQVTKQFQPRGNPLPETKKGTERFLLSKCNLTAKRESPIHPPRQLAGLRKEKEPDSSAETVGGIAKRERARFIRRDSWRDCEKRKSPIHPPRQLAG